jgi:two-component system invasion response regulator UvrY
MVAGIVVDATEGFELVGEAETGEEAVEAAGRLRPDLVLMDVNLPGISGAEATRRIVAVAPRTVVLLLSTYGAAEYERLAEECGAAAFVPKSEFGPDRLARSWLAASPT